MWRLAGRYSSVGIEIALAIGVGTGLGYWADRHFGSDPYLFIAGMVLGLATATRTIIRVVRRTDFDRL